MKEGASAELRSKLAPLRAKLEVNAAVRANAVVPARSHARAAESLAKLSAAAGANAVVPAFSQKISINN